MGIIGVLGGISIPAYNQYKNNANSTAVKVDVGNSQKAYLAKDAAEGSFCHTLDAVGLGSLGASDLYTKATKSFVGFNNTCGSLAQNTLQKKVGTMTATSCSISDASFTLGGGFEKGTQKVGYFISQTDAGPSKSTQSTSCGDKSPANPPGGGANPCSHASRQNDENQCPTANCVWTAGIIADLCS